MASRRCCVAIMNANWDLAKQLIVAGADVNQWDMYGEAPLFTAIGQRNQLDGGRASIDPLNETNGTGDRSACCSSAAPIRTCSFSSARRM